MGLARSNVIPLPLASWWFSPDVMTSHFCPTKLGNSGLDSLLVQASISSSSSLSINTLHSRFRTSTGALITGEISEKSLVFSHARGGFVWLWGKQKVHS